MSTTPEPVAGQSEVKRSRVPRNVPLAFMLLVLGVYILTMSGHTYSPDEETMLATSQALVLKGTWELPQSRNLVEVTGVDGKRYSQYGPGQSLAALPWVLVGHIASNLFPKGETGFPLRLILGSYNALIAAGICALFVATGLALGYSRRASLFVAGALAFSTFLWPHSRTFFSEPLAGLCLFASFYLMLISAPMSAWLDGGHWSHRNKQLAIISGVLFALAVAVKVQYVVALPAFLVFLVWGIAETRRKAPRSPTNPDVVNAREVGAENRATTPNPLSQGPLSTPAWWLIGLGLGLVPLFLYNLAVFGSALTTGYGADLKGTFKTPLSEGAYGLLLSSGKGLLWYALPVTLSIWGFLGLAREHKGRNRAVAAFVAVLSLSMVAFFGLYAFWPGDGSWGPRYLMPLLPFALLPAMSAVKHAMRSHRSWGRIAVSTVVALGFLVNALGVLVNFDTYINVVNDDLTRYWTPDASPIVGHANLFNQRVREVVSNLTPHPGTVSFKSGFSYSEGDKARGELLPRWTTGAGVLDIRPHTAQGPISVTLRLTDHRPPDLPRAQVMILVGGVSVQAQAQPVQSLPISTDYVLSVPADPFNLTIQSDTWNPSKLQEGGRNEDLGVLLESITITDPGEPRAYQMADAIKAPPYYPQPRWYYDPGTHHPADLWFVYMAETGMGRKAMLALALPLVAAGLACLILGLRGLRATS